MPNVAFMFESEVKSRGDVLTVMGEDCSRMFIIDEGDVGIVASNDLPLEEKKLLNLQAVDYVGTTLETSCPTWTISELSVTSGSSASLNTGTRLWSSNNLRLCTALIKKISTV